MPGPFNTVNHNTKTFRIGKLASEVGRAGVVLIGRSSHVNFSALKL